MEQKQRDKAKKSANNTCSSSYRVLMFSAIQWSPNATILIWIDRRLLRLSKETLFTSFGPQMTKL